MVCLITMLTIGAVIAALIGHNVLAARRRWRGQDDHLTYRRQ
jgi:hypothetical protein